MQNIDLAAMRDRDIRTIDKSELIDAEDIKIDITKPKNERIQDYIRQAVNPYFLNRKGNIIKVSFSETDLTINDALESFLY